jgi:hypothetical protein
VESYQDAYVFVRSAGIAEQEFADPGGMENLSFDLTTGGFARLYVLKSDAFPQMAKFLQGLNGFEVDKALALDTPYRIVHYGTFHFMAFVQVYLRGDADPHRVLQVISQFRTFKGGARVQGGYDLLVEFGDDNDLAPVQSDADAVRTVAGVSRRVISTTVVP